MLTEAVVEHVVTSLPAVAIIGLLTKNVFVEVTFPQGAIPLALSVNVTLPAKISNKLGVYVQVVKELTFVKLPEPLDNQVTDE